MKQIDDSNDDDLFFGGFELFRFAIGFCFDKLLLIKLLNCLIEKGDDFHGIVDKLKIELFWVGKEMFGVDIEVNDILMSGLFF